LVKLVTIKNNVLQLNVHIIDVHVWITVRKTNPDGDTLSVTCANLPLINSTICG
jgi:hypothetical protein